MRKRFINCDRESHKDGAQIQRLKREDSRSGIEATEVLLLLTSPTPLPLGQTGSHNLSFASSSSPPPPPLPPPLPPHSFFFFFFFFFFRYFFFLSFFFFFLIFVIVFVFSFEYCGGNTDYFDDKKSAHMYKTPKTHNGAIFS